MARPPAVSWSSAKELTAARQQGKAHAEQAGRVGMTRPFWSLVTHIHTCLPLACGQWGGNGGALASWGEIEATQSDAGHRACLRFETLFPHL